MSKGVAVVGVLVVLLATWALYSGPAAGISPRAPLIVVKEVGLGPTPTPASLGHQPDLAGGALPTIMVPEEPTAQLLSPAPGPMITVEITAALARSGFPQAPAAQQPLELGVSVSWKTLGEPLLTVVTDDDGKALAQLPWNAVLDLGDVPRPLIWARSQGLGMLRRVEVVKAPGQAGETVPLGLHVQPGVLVEGVIVGPDGVPVAGEVSVVILTEWGAASRLLGKAGPDGRFRGEVYTEGPQVFLARGTDDPDYDGKSWFPGKGEFSVGRGVLGVLDLRFEEPPPSITVQLFGPGVLQGHVRDGAGHPAAGLELRAVLAERDQGQGVPGPLKESLEEFIVRERGGDSEGVTVTDDQGAFTLRGLRDDRFNIWASFGHDFPQEQQLLTVDPVPSRGRPLELRLSRPHLAIHVRHQDGSMPEEGFTFRESRSRDVAVEWSQQTALMVSITPDDEQWMNLGQTYLSGRATGPGEFIVETDGQRSVDLGVHGGGVPWQPLRVAVPKGSSRIDVDLVIPTPVALGSLVLDVQDGGGDAVLQDIRVRLLGPQSGVILVERRFPYSEADDWPLRWELPGGEYRLVVEGQAALDGHHGYVEQAREHGAFETLVQISAGVERSLTATLGAGAWLQLRLLGTPDDADLAATRRLFSRTSATEADFESWAGEVSLRLEQPGRWTGCPYFKFAAMANTSAAGLHLFTSLLLGREATSEMLTPGSYTLVARTPGGRTVRQSVVFVPGQTLPVTIAFE